MNSGLLQFPNTPSGEQYQFPVSRRGKTFYEFPHFQPCSEYQAVLDRAIALGYTLPSIENQKKQNAFMMELRKYNILSHLEALRVFKNCDNLNFSSVDWADPTRTVSTNVNSPTLDDAKGVKSNGTTSYVNPNVIPSTLTKYTLNNASHGSYLGDTLPNGSINTSMAATFDGSFQSQFLITNTPRTFFSVNSGGSVNAGVLLNKGMNICQRFNSASVNLITNGLIINSVEASTNRPTVTWYICARNNNGTADLFNTDYQALWFAGDSLKYYEAAFKTACDNFYAS